jgi:hypothetical protein
VISGSRSLCGGLREVIAPMLELGLSAQRIYQDLVAGHGFGGSYAKNNALKGRQFATLGEQNAHLLHWEEQVADKRVHGTTRRQVTAVFEEERKALGPLPASVYESYQEGRCRVQRDSFVEVAKAYYEAPPEFIGR